MFKHNSCFDSEPFLSASSHSLYGEENIEIPIVVQYNTPHVIASLSTKVSTIHSDAI